MIRSDKEPQSALHFGQRFQPLSISDLCHELASASPASFASPTTFAKLSPAPQHPPSARSFEIRLPAASTRSPRCCATPPSPSASLPLPSRRAIQFLKTIRWDAPIEASPPTVQPRRKLPVRLPSLSTFARRTLALLAEPQNPQTLEKVLRSIRQASDKTEHALRTAGALPEGLTRTARDSYATIRFLASEQNLSVYVRAVATARAIFKPYAQRGPLPVAPDHSL